MFSTSKKGGYLSPETKRVILQLEESVCAGAVASGNEAMIQQENIEIEVEEYESFENQVTFD